MEKKYVAVIPSQLIMHRERWFPAGEQGDNTAYDWPYDVEVPFGTKMEGTVNVPQITVGDYVYTLRIVRGEWR